MVATVEDIDVTNQLVTVSGPNNNWVVVKVEPEQNRVLGIGGNVRGSVSLKLLPAEFTGDGAVAPLAKQVGQGRGMVFAHLKLRSDPVGDDVFRLSPTLRKVEEQPDTLEKLKATLEQAVHSLSQSVLL